MENLPEGEKGHSWRLIEMDDTFTREQSLCHNGTGSVFTPKTVLLIDNHMYGRLADAKLLCGGTDGGPVLYDVKSQALGPVLHISLQKHSLPALWCFQSMQAGSGYEFVLVGEWFTNIFISAV